MQINSLVTNIEQAYAAFRNELNRFSSADQINSDMLAALYFARASSALATTGSPSTGVQNRLQIVAGRLGQVKNFMIPGSVTATGATLSNHASSLTATAIIGPADARSSGNFASVLVPLSLGVILGDPVQSPLAVQTSEATKTASGALPYELAGVSVTIGGRAAPLLSVSPSRITYCVPAGLENGVAEVIVTLQEGYVSRGTTSIASIAPALFSVDGTGAGAGLVWNAATSMQGPFEVTTQRNLGKDKRTRLVIHATGFSNATPNSNTGNDLSNGRDVIPNLAESVAVEARTSDGRTFDLPVEFAGKQTLVAGLDQVNVILIPELRGSGSVSLTLVIGNQRSNSVTVSIK